MGSKVGGFTGGGLAGKRLRQCIALSQGKRKEGWVIVWVPMGVCMSRKTGETSIDWARGTEEDFVRVFAPLVKLGELGANKKEPQTAGTGCGQDESSSQDSP